MFLDVVDGVDMARVVLMVYNLGHVDANVYAVERSSHYTFVVLNFLSYKHNICMADDVNIF